MLETIATFSAIRNDMFWRYYSLTDGEFRWVGYNDDYWWDNVSVDPKWATQTGKSGRKYTLDPASNVVTVSE